MIGLFFNKLKYLFTKFKQFINFSDDVNPYELLFIHPQLTLMVAFVSNYCHQNNLDFKITSIIRTVEENKKVKAKSMSHVDARAVDFSLKGFKESQIKELEHEINSKFSDIGAISASDGLSRPIVVHMGTGYHAHLQIRPNL